MKRILTVLLACMVMIGQMGIISYGESDSTAKEEVIYVNLTSEGDVDSIHAVNIFTDKRDITDYGEYSSVKNLTTTDEINKAGDRITISTKSDKLYYQGNMKTRDIPWKISMKYFLDGKKMTSDEIAGQSGKFKMIIEIRKNKGFDESFFKGYALQASLNLDSARFKNLEADKATMANEGSDKKLTYIILPGNETRLEITADASDIELDSISINAVKLNLNMEFDSSRLMKKTDLLKEKVDELNHGAGELNDKAGELKGGAKTILKGSEALDEGVKKLNTGTEKLEKGAVLMENVLNGKDTSELVEGSTEYLKAITQFSAYAKLVKIDVENIEKLTETSEMIKAGILSLEDGLKKLEGQISGYEAQVDDSLKAAGIDGTSDLAAKNREAAAALKETNPELAALLMADAQYIEGSSAEISGLKNGLSKDGELRKGAAKLASSYEAFDENISLLAETVKEMAGNLDDMKKNLDALVENYEKIDGGIKTYAKGIEDVKDGFDILYDGILSVADGSRKLLEGSAELTDGTMRMYDGALSFAEGTGKLSKGTGIFSKSIKDIDSEALDEVNDVIDEETGKNQPVRSFTSEKNENVESVMFVMKTPEVEKEKAEQKEEKEKKKLNIFQKFIALFRK